MAQSRNLKPRRRAIFGRSFRSPVSPQAHAIFEKYMPIAERAMAATPSLKTTADFDAFHDKLLGPSEAQSDAEVKALGATSTASKLGGVGVVETTPPNYVDDGTVLVRVHGGGWVLGSARASAGSDAVMAMSTGRRIISVDYTVAPHGKWPLITDQVVAVYRAVLAKGYKPENVGIYGDSAGANIVPGSVLKMRDQGIPMPGAMLLLSPCVDLHLNGDTETTLGNADPVLALGPVRDVVLAYADPADWSNPYASPIYGDFKKGFPPVLIQVGTKEMLLSDSVRLYQAIKMAGGEAELDVYEGMTHVFQGYMRGTPEQKEAFAEIGHFWKRHLIAAKHRTTALAGRMALQPRGLSGFPCRIRGLSNLTENGWKLDLFVDFANMASRIASVRRGVSGAVCEEHEGEVTWRISRVTGYSAWTARSGCRAGRLDVLAARDDSPALAQQNSTVETVTVTAERRTIDAQKAPVAVTVFNQEDLNKRAINTVDQLQFTTPSLTILDSGVNAVINIRGIGKSDAGAQDSSGVLIYRDGVSTTPNGLIADEPYYDIASVEVLRGPQGTFAGQNATGGAIFIKEADPTLGHMNGWVEAQYGNYNDIRFRGAVNVPLTDDLAIRIATDDENRDTFFHMTGPFTGNPGNLHETNWRLGTLWKPTEHFQAVLKFDYNYVDHGGSPAAPFTGNTKNIFDVASDSHLSGIEQQYRGTLNMDYQFDNGITLKSISGYQLGRLAYALDADGTATHCSLLGNSPEIFRRARHRSDAVARNRSRVARNRTIDLGRGWRLPERSPEHAAIHSVLDAVRHANHGRRAECVARQSVAGQLGHLRPVGLPDHQRSQAEFRPSLLRDDVHVA